MTSKNGEVKTIKATAPVAQPLPITLTPAGLYPRTFKTGKTGFGGKVVDQNGNRYQIIGAVLITK